MSIESARAHLAQFGKENDILFFQESSATVELAAQAVTALQNQLRDRDSRPVSISIANEFTPGGSLAAPRNPRREL